MFTDNCVLFGETIESGAHGLKRILPEYEVCSGQCINFDKSTILFSSNTPVSMRMQLSSRMGVRYSNNSERYLSLPNLVGKNKKNSFHVLKDHIRCNIDC